MKWKTTVEYPVPGNDPDSESNPSFAPDGYEFAGWKLLHGTGESDMLLTLALHMAVLAPLAVGAVIPRKRRADVGAQ